MAPSRSSDRGARNVHTRRNLAKRISDFPARSYNPAKAVPGNRSVPQGGKLKPMAINLAGTVRTILQGKGQDVYCLPPEATVYNALEMMAAKKTGALLVIGQGKLLGIISERDYARKGILQGRMSKQTPVSEVMVSPAVVATLDSTVEECMRLMTANRVRHLAIVDTADPDKVIGVVSVGDLVKSTISAQADTIDRLQEYISGKYPG
jgi:CBS domain-containing protein